MSSQKRRDLQLVLENGLNIRHVKQNAELCRLAIQNNPYALYYIEPHRQRHDMCLMAVQKSWEVLEYVIEQTPDICAAALAQSKDAQKFIRKDGHNPYILWYMGGEEEDGMYK